MEERLDELIRQAVLDHGGPRDPFGDFWDMKAQIVSGSADGGSVSVWVKRNAHPTEGLKAFQRYDMGGLVRYGDRWEPVPWLAAAIDEMVITARQLELRDDVVRSYGDARDDHDGGGPVTRDRTHRHAPPPWAYCIDRVIRKIAIGAGWNTREISTPAGHAFDAVGMPSRYSINGLQLIGLSRTMPKLTTYSGSIHGMRIDAEMQISGTAGGNVTMMAHDGQRLISMDDADDMPWTVMQGMVGMDVGEVVALPGIQGPIGVPITDVTRQGKTLHVLHPCVLDPLDDPPGGVGVEWMHPRN